MKNSPKMTLTPVLSLEIYLRKKRTALIKNIKAGKIRYLIATDVASRGLHIPGITHVYNFDLPSDPANYIHRIGRTARAGAKGFSYSLVCDDYGSHLLDINTLLQYDIPCHWYPEEFLNISLKKPAKPSATSSAKKDRRPKKKSPARSAQRQRSSVSLKETDEKRPRASSKKSATTPTKDLLKTEKAEKANKPREQSHQKGWKNLWEKVAQKTKDLFS